MPASTSSTTRACSWSRRMRASANTTSSRRGESSYRVTTRGLQVDAVVEPEHGRARKRPEKKDAGAISAPIPGVVTNVQVEEGQQVEHNQVVVVLESMKMLMEFRAPFAGEVEKIFVEKGQKLEKGDEMVRINQGGVRI